MAQKRVAIMLGSAVVGVAIKQINEACKLRGIKMILSPDSLQSYPRAVGQGVWLSSYANTWVTLLVGEDVINASYILGIINLEEWFKTIVSCEEHKG